MRSSTSILQQNYFDFDKSESIKIHQGLQSLFLHENKLGTCKLRVKTLMFADHNPLFLWWDIQKKNLLIFPLFLFKISIFPKMLITFVLFAFLTYYYFAFLKNTNKLITDKHLILKIKLRDFKITYMRMKLLFVLHYPVILIQTKKERTVVLTLSMSLSC